MTNLLKISAVLFLICFASCTTEPIIEETPQSQIIPTGGFDINVTGELNGVPFTLFHTSDLEKNYPVTGQAPRAHISNFSRKNELTDPVASDQLIVAITANMQEGNFLNTVAIGEYDWYDIAEVSNEAGKAFLGDIYLGGERYITAFDPGENAFNKFEVTSVTPIDDSNLDSQYRDKLFMVEGSFKCLVSNSNEFDFKHELVIDHFSLIFINE